MPKIPYGKIKGRVTASPKFKKSIAKVADHKEKNKYGSVAERKLAFCSSFNFQVLPTSRDGSCQFHSVLQALEQDGVENLPTVSSLRITLANALEEHVSQKNSFYLHQLVSLFCDSPTHRSLDAFISQYNLGLRTRALGDTLTLNLMADSLGVEIHVYHPNLTNGIVPENIFRGVQGHSCSDKRVVRILFMQEHYETLILLTETRHGGVHRNVDSTCQPSLEVGSPCHTNDLRSSEGVCACQNIVSPFSL